MIKVLTRPTITHNSFMDKEAILSANTAQNFALVCKRFLASTWSTSHLLSFVSVS